MVTLVTLVTLVITHIRSSYGLGRGRHLVQLETLVVEHSLV